MEGGRLERGRVGEMGSVGLEALGRGGGEEQGEGEGEQLTNF